MKGKRMPRSLKVGFKRVSIQFALLAVIGSACFMTGTQQARAQEVRPMLFPVIGAVNYANDFGAPRSGGRTHEGNDLMGRKMQPVVAVVDGVLEYVQFPEPSWGYAISIRDSEGFKYNYLHMNNDTPGTDNNSGGGYFAYAPDMVRGNPVKKGQLVGYLGDSGNAEATAPHIHFEIRRPDNSPINPYFSLQQAQKITTPVTDYAAYSYEILPYGDFRGGVNTAAGNIDADTAIEIISAPAANGGPHVRMFNPDKTPAGEFFAYDGNFLGGVDVAAADIDGDGKAEIVTAPANNGGPHIKIFKADGTLISQFFAYDGKFFGGVRVAAADIDGDGKAEIVTAPANNGGPHIKIFKADGRLVNQFFAYSTAFMGGVDVAAIPARSITQKGMIVTAPFAGGGPHVKLYNSDLQVVKEFYAYDPGMTYGIRVAAGNIVTTTADWELAVIPASNIAGPHMMVFDQTGATVQSRIVAFEEWWRGGYDITVAGNVYVSSSFPGPLSRRASIRSVR